MKNELTAEIKKVVLKRLEALPPNVTFSIGDLGTFTRDELIEEVKEGSEAGNAAIDMQLDFIRKMPFLASLFN